MSCADPALHPALALEALRCERLVAGDIDALAPLLSDDLAYVHSTGAVHGRDELLAWLRGGVRFETVERRGLRLHRSSSDDVAWTTGLMLLRAWPPGAAAPVGGVTFVSQLWRRERDGTWRLQLLQSTQVDPRRWEQAAG